jgi:16S rRNA (adenine1518-N6/adenine1519-N6)-dimethyltransferase
MVQPKKHLGQHFLKDENIAQKIVSSLANQSRNIIEVGPGTGVLTKFLIEKTNNLYLIEIDRESIAFLNKQFPKLSEKIIQADFLKYDLSKLFEDPFSIIGNFPYNISTQILFRALEYRNQVTEVIGMFQKEVAERIASPPGSKKYGILSVLLQIYFDIEYLFTVNENVFFPPPKVKSAVIRLRRNNVKHPGCDEKLLVSLVKTAFNQRRKMLRNPLKIFTFEDNEKVANLMTKRAEQLSKEDFIFLTNSIITKHS